MKSHVKFICIDAVVWYVMLTSIEMVSHFIDNFNNNNNNKQSILSLAHDLERTSFGMIEIHLCKISQNKLGRLK